VGIGYHESKEHNRLHPGKTNVLLTSLTLITP